MLTNIYYWVLCVCQNILSTFYDSILKKKKKTHCEVWLSPANISIPKMRKQTEILNSFPNVIQLVSGKNVSKRIVIKLL